MIDLVGPSLLPVVLTIAQYGYFKLAFFHTFARFVINTGAYSREKNICRKDAP